MRRDLEQDGVEVVGRDQGGLRAALDYLRDERGARRITLEAGPSTAVTAYQEPCRIDELLLSIFDAPALAPGFAAGELPSRARLERTLGPPRASCSVVEPSGRWTFEHYRCAMVRDGAASGAAGSPPDRLPRLGRPR